MLVKTLDGTALVEKPVPPKKFKYVWLVLRIEFSTQNVKNG